MLCQEVTTKQWQKPWKWYVLLLAADAWLWRWILKRRLSCL